MITKTYKIADHIIEIKSLYQEIHDLCEDYTHCGNADFSISIEQSDINFEREKSVAERKIEGLSEKIKYADSYLETLAVYRKIAEYMIERDIILFHGSVIAVDGTGYLFTAKSGTGKSTHTRLWREYFGDRAYMVNDDKPLLKISENEVIAYGTPWDGKHKLSSNTAVPLKGICILSRDEYNHIEEINISEVYPMLIQQTYRPKTPNKMLKTLKLIDKLANTTKLFKLGCNMDIEAAIVAYNGMKGNE